jgi:dTDP-4-amino-4,6-dideoxygalactose transaminase
MAFPLTKDNIKHIAFNLPSIGEEEIQEVISVLRSGWITTGPRTEAFEKQFADYVQAGYAIAVNSCTSGLHLALAANNIGPGDEVITTPYTFAATGEVILHTGATPILVDVEEDGFNIDPAAISRAITKRTKAIIPVHFAGEPCNMDDIMAIAERHGLWVIEDAAHACGTAYKGKIIGSIGHQTVFSFYATKNLTTGEGGMITTNDEKMAQRLRMLSLHGLSKDAWKRYSATGKWRYDICELGYKYNMSDIQAAIGIHQLKKFDALQAKRLELVRAYQEHLADVEEIILPPDPQDIKHAWHLFVIRLRSSMIGLSRDAVIELLSSFGIGTSVHFIPLHFHPYYRMRYGFAAGDFPNAEKAFEGAISLPLYPGLGSAEVEYIANTLRGIIASERLKVTSFAKLEVC